MKRIYMAIITILCSIGIAISIAQAWFINGFDVDPLATGSSTEAYYHSGTGTQSDPYIITTPRHLYNLAWLQYLGTYNKDKKNGLNFPATYFKIGTSAGITIDMTGWPLPPIGTAKYPFIGNFNGNGATILNLTSTNNFTEFGDKHPSGVDNLNFEADYCGTVGFFGAIGAYNANIISESDSTNDNYTYDTANNKAYNFYLNNTNVHTCRSTTLIGAVAGYVNAKIEDVGVIQPHLNIQASASSKLASKTSNLSDFAVVGYAEEQYTTQKTKTSTIIYNPTYDYSHFNFKGMGSQADWGGSMNMSDLYSRIVEKIPYTAQNYTYVNNELRYNYSDTKYTTTATTSNMRVSVSNDETGNYSKYLQTTARYNYLNTVYKNVVEVTRTNVIENGYTITSNEEYLIIDSSRVNNTITFDVEVSSDTDESTVWVEESSGGGVKLYTYNADDGYKYYLVGNSDLSLSVSNSTSSIWHWNGNTYYTTINTTNYFLKYFHGEWTIRPTFAISDGNGNYIKYENNAISNSTTLSEATEFMLTDDSKLIENDGYYLRNNPVGTLSIGATNSYNIWENKGGQLLNERNDINYYIHYDNGWKLTTATSYYIQYNGNYLYINNSGVLQTAGTTSINTATPFTFSDDLSIDGGEGTISATINNNTYYLRYNGTTLSAVTATDQYTTWGNNGGLYRNYNNTVYYLQYNSGWKMAEAAKIQYYTIYSTYQANNYYLVTNGTTAVTYSNNTSTNWYLEANNNLYTLINGIKYYIYRDGDGSGNAKLTADANHANLAYKDGNYIRSRNNSDSLYYRSNTYRYYFRNGNYAVTFNQYSLDDFENTPIGAYTASNVNISLTLLGNSIRTSTSINKYTRTENIVEPSVFNYIPLNVTKKNNQYVVDDSNTGYIMSGSYSDTDYQGRDIRVSEYYINNINRNGANVNYNQSSTNVSLGNNTTERAQNFVSFKDNVIKTVNSNGITNINDSSNSFVKYSSSKTNLEDVLSNSGSNNNYFLYGLHFMSATININHLVTAPRVLINGVYYNNYQMPEDCIDFTVANNGYINFFAGTYFPANDAFFSLHQIFRDNTDANDDGIPDNPVITGIKHIYRIYKANSNYGTDYKTADVVYYYSDTTYSQAGFNPNSNQYDLVFDYSWIENPGTYQNLGNQNDYRGNVFYFEIPVNKGEFALGSVENKTGAYLFYLDIGANAAPVDRTEITQKTTTKQEVLVYASGIQILAPDQTFTSDVNSCVATIENTKSGQISISRTGDTVTFSQTLNSKYKDEAITFNGTITPVSELQTTSIVLRYVDYNRATDKLYFTTIYNNGTTNTSYDCYRIDDLANGTKTQITDTSDQAEWGLLKIVSGAGTHTTDVTDSAFAINMQSVGNTKILDYYSYINTTEISTYSLTTDMSIETNATLPPADGDYAYEHAYKLVGNDITLTPNGLLIYIGPDLKATATISNPTNNVVTVTIGSYVFTFNANAMNNTNKTVTIYVASS